MTEIVINQLDNITLDLTTFRRENLLIIQSLDFAILETFYLDFAYFLCLLEQATSRDTYSLRNSYYLLMDSSTLCFTLSNKNWYCSFYILEMGSFPKISLTVQNYPSYLRFLYVLETIYYIMSSFMVIFYRFSSFIIQINNINDSYGIS